MSLHPLTCQLSKPERLHWNNAKGGGKGLCMSCGNSRNFAASCLRKLNAASGKMDINPFKKDPGKGNNKENKPTKSWPE
jgi:hypothetical protein